MRQPESQPWWTVPPPEQVSHLVDVPSELLAIALDPLPDGSPAVVRFRPSVGLGATEQTMTVLAGLDRTAIALFPHWLPDAGRSAGPDRLDTQAVRELAALAATRSAHFGPFLVELAERGLLGSVGSVGTSRFPAEVRAAGLARVVAGAYRRTSTVLLVDLPADRSAADEQAITATAEWLVQHGRFTVWFTGTPLHAVDRVREVRLRLPEALTRLATTAAGPGPAVASVAVEPTPTGAGTGRAGLPRRQRRTAATGPAGAATPLLSCPAPAGQPRADSVAERALERALARQDWAHGRQWNHTHEWHTLGRPYRLDLFWAVEGLVVEVDGPEHRGLLKFADDRQRDVHLQLLGYAVLRFTNEQVLADIDTVVRQIRQLLVRRRSADREQWKEHDVDGYGRSGPDAEPDQRPGGVDGGGT